jgi:predicted PhzF superfamily epimerase YddE/YHI9
MFLLWSAIQEDHVSFLPNFWWGDAFTRTPFLGNPAAVVFLDGHELSVCNMQTLANEFKCSQTAFINRKNGVFSIRWFSPQNGGETPICGHATLVSAKALFSSGIVTSHHVTFLSCSGPLSVYNEKDHLRMVFRSRKLREENVYPFLPQAIACYRDDLIHVAEFKTFQDVKNFIPDLKAISGLEGRALCITAPGHGEVDFVSRYFAPKVGIDEDPVCGSSYCRLTPLWSKKLNKTFLKTQPLSSRGGELTLELKNDDVHYFTNAVIIGQGTLGDVFSLCEKKESIAV